MALGILFGLLVAFFFFLLLQKGYHSVDGGIAVGLTHGGKLLERILQVDSLGIGYEFVEYFGTLGQLGIVLAVFVQQADGLTITAACI